MANFKGKINCRTGIVLNDGAKLIGGLDMQWDDVRTTEDRGQFCGKLIIYWYCTKFSLPGG